MAEIETGGIALVWEAIHATPEDFGGALIDTAAKEAVLFYPGKAVRTGFLVWQKNRMNQAATVDVVSTRDNGDLWSATLGERFDLSALRTDEIQLALRVAPLRLGARTILGWVSAGRHAGELFCLDRQDKGLRWQTPCWEADEAHVSPDGSRVLIGTLDGAIRLLDGATGATVAELGGGAHEAPEAALGDRGGVLLEEGTLRGFDPAGRVVWTLDMIGAEAAMGAERLCVSGDGCFVAEPGTLKRVSLADGATVWRSDSIRGHELVVAEHGPFVSVHEPTEGTTRVFRADTGAPVRHELLEGLHHVAWIGKDLVGSTEEGAVVRAGADGQPRWKVQSEALHAGPLAAVGNDVIVLAVDDQDRPALLRLDGRTGQGRGFIPSPVGGAPRLDAVGANLFALSNPIAVFLYSVS